MSLKEFTEISPEVRKKVYDRDSHDDAPCCILCGRPYPEVHHYIERSRGGMGIEENLVCLCSLCHKYLHNTGDPASQDFIRRYLKHKYPDWEESKLVKSKTYQVFKKEG